MLRPIQLISRTVSDTDKLVLTEQVIKFIVAMWALSLSVIYPKTL